MGSVSSHLFSRSTKSVKIVDERKPKDVVQSMPQDETKAVNGKTDSSELRADEPDVKGDSPTPHVLVSIMKDKTIIISEGKTAATQTPDIEKELEEIADSRLDYLPRLNSLEEEIKRSDTSEPPYSTRIYEYGDRVNLKNSRNSKYEDLQTPTLEDELEYECEDNAENKENVKLEPKPKGVAFVNIAVGTDEIVDDTSPTKVRKDKRYETEDVITTFEDKAVGTVNDKSVNTEIEPSYESEKGITTYEDKAVETVNDKSVNTEIISSFQYESGRGSATFKDKSVGTINDKSVNTEIVSSLQYESGRGSATFEDKAVGTINDKSVNTEIVSSLQYESGRGSATFEDKAVGTINDKSVNTKSVSSYQYESGRGSATFEDKAVGTINDKSVNTESVSSYQYESGRGSATFEDKAVGTINDKSVNTEIVSSLQYESGRGSATFEDKAVGTINDKSMNTEIVSSLQYESGRGRATFEDKAVGTINDKSVNTEIVSSLQYESGRGSATFEDKAVGTINDKSMNTEIVSSLQYKSGRGSATFEDKAVGTINDKSVNNEIVSSYQYESGRGSAMFENKAVGTVDDKSVNTEIISSYQYESGRGHGTYENKAFANYVTVNKDESAMNDSDEKKTIAFFENKAVGTQETANVKSIKESSEKIKNVNSDFGDKAVGTEFIQNEKIVNKFNQRNVTTCTDDTFDEAYPLKNTNYYLKREQETNTFSLEDKEVGTETPVDKAVGTEENVDTTAKVSQNVMNIYHNDHNKETSSEKDQQKTSNKELTVNQKQFTGTLKDKAVGTEEFVIETTKNDIKENKNGTNKGASSSFDFRNDQTDTEKVNTKSVKHKQETVIVSVEEKAERTDEILKNGKGEEIGDVDSNTGDEENKSSKWFDNIQPIRPFGEVSLERYGKYKVRLDSENENCIISAATFLDTGDMVAIDRSNQKIKFVDSQFRYISSEKLPAKPWAVCARGIDVYVTMGNTQIQHLFIKDMTFELERVIDIKGRCLGICLFEEHLAVGLQVGEVCLIDTMGEVRGTIQLPQVDGGKPCNPWHLCETLEHNLLVTDSDAQMIFCLNKTGDIVFTFKGLSSPRGTVIDSGGNIVIVGRDKETGVVVTMLPRDMELHNMLHIEDKPETRCRALLTWEQLEFVPYCVSYRRDNTVVLGGLQEILKIMKMV